VAQLDEINYKESLYETNNPGHHKLVGSVY
jgi:hypothetical protein